MEDLQAYVLSVTAGAVLCTLAVMIVGEKGTSAAIVRLICGIIMASIVIKPLGNLVSVNLSGYYGDLEAQAAAAVSAGTETAYRLTSERIKEQTCSYILDKAESLGLSLEVDVTLDRGTIPVPIQVSISGHASPSARSALTQIISQDLGIGKEDQIWN